MTEAIRDFFEARADLWDELAVHPEEKVARLLDAAGGLAGARVLDVGCGTGVLTLPLLRRTAPAGRVLGLDLSPRMVGLAKGKLAAAAAGDGAALARRADFVVADFLAWTAPEPFDLVAAYSCYPHFLEPDAFWRAAVRCLAPGGRVLVAHIESRAAINAHHASGASRVSRPLEAAEAAAARARAAGLRVELSEDSAERYFVLAAEDGRKPS